MDNNYENPAADTNRFLPATLNQSGIPFINNDNDDDIINTIQQDIADCTTQSLETYANFMTKLLEFQQPLKDSQLKEYHHKILQVIESTFLGSFDVEDYLKTISEDLKSKTDSLLQQGKKNLHILINKQLNEVYLRKQELQNESVLKLVKGFSTQAEAKYDQQSEKFQFLHKRPKQVKEAHDKWKIEAFALFDQLLHGNNLEPLDFRRCELNLRLNERLEGYLDDCDDKEEDPSPDLLRHEKSNKMSSETTQQIAQLESEDLQNEAIENQSNYTKDLQRAAALTQVHDETRIQELVKLNELEPPVVDNSNTDNQEPARETESNTEIRESQNEKETSAAIQALIKPEKHINSNSMQRNHMPQEKQYENQTTQNSELLIPIPNINQQTSKSSPEPPPSHTKPTQQESQQRITHTNRTSPGVPPRDWFFSPNSQSETTKTETPPMQNSKSSLVENLESSKTTTLILNKQKPNTNTDLNNFNEENKAEISIKPKIIDHETSTQTVANAQSQIDHVLDVTPKPKPILETTSVPALNRSEEGPEPKSNPVPVSERNQNFHQENQQKTNSRLAARLSGYAPLFQNDDTKEFPKHFTASQVKLSLQSQSQVQYRNQQPPTVPPRNPQLNKDPQSEKTIPDKNNSGPKMTVTNYNRSDPHSFLPPTQAKLGHSQFRSKSTSDLRAAVRSPVPQEKLATTSVKPKYELPVPRKNSMTVSQTVVSRNKVKDTSVQNEEIIIKPQHPKSKTNNSLIIDIKTPSVAQRIAALTSGQKTKTNQQSKLNEQPQAKQLSTLNQQLAPNQQPTVTQQPPVKRQSVVKQQSQVNQKPAINPKPKNLINQQTKSTKQEASETPGKPTASANLFIKTNIYHNIKDLSVKTERAKTQSNSVKTEIHQLESTRQLSQQIRNSLNTLKSNTATTDTKTASPKPIPETKLPESKSSIELRKTPLKGAVSASPFLQNKGQKSQTKSEIVKRSTSPNTTNSKLATPNPQHLSSLRQQNDVVISKNSNWSKQTQSSSPQKDVNGFCPTTKFEQKEEKKILPSPDSSLKKHEIRGILSKIKTSGTKIAVGIFCDKNSFNIGTFQASSLLDSAPSFGDFKKIKCLTPEICYSPNGVLIGKEASIYKNQKKHGYFNIFELITSSTSNLQFQHSNNTLCIHKIISTFFENALTPSNMGNNIKPGKIVLTIPKVLSSAKKEIIKMSVRKAGFSDIIILSTTMTAALDFTNKGGNGSGFKTLPPAVKTLPSQIFVLHYEQNSFSVGIVTIGSGEICLNSLHGSDSLPQFQDELFRANHTLMLKGGNVRDPIKIKLQKAYEEALEHVLDNKNLPVTKLAISEKRSHAIENILPKTLAGKCIWVDETQSSFKGASLLSFIACNELNIKIQEPNFPLFPIPAAGTSDSKCNCTFT